MTLGLKSFFLFQTGITEPKLKELVKEFATVRKGQINKSSSLHKVHLMVVCQLENFAQPFYGVCQVPIFDKDKFTFTVSKVFPMAICDSASHEMTVLTTKSGAVLPASCRLVDECGAVVNEKVEDVNQTGSYFQFTFSPTNRLGIFKLDILIELDGKLVSALDSQTQIEVVRHVAANCLLCKANKATTTVKRRKSIAPRVTNGTKRRTSNSTSSSASSLSSSWTPSPNDTGRSSVEEANLSGINEGDYETEANDNLPVESILGGFVINSNEPSPAVSCAVPTSSAACNASNHPASAMSFQRTFANHSTVGATFASREPQQNGFTSGASYLGSSGTNPEGLYWNRNPPQPTPASVLPGTNTELEDVSLEELCQHPDFDIARNWTNQPVFETGDIEMFDVIDGPYFGRIAFDGAGASKTPALDGCAPKEPMPEPRPEPRPEQLAQAEPKRLESYNFDYVIIFALLGILYHFVRSFFFLD